MDFLTYKTWTWDELMERLGGGRLQGEVPFGVEQIFGSVAISAPGCGSTARSCSSRMAPGSRCRRRGVVRADGEVPEGRGPRDLPPEISEEGQGPRPRPLAESAMVLGNAATQAGQHQPAGSRQRCVRKNDADAVGPDLTGKGDDRKAWYKADHVVVGVGQDQQPGRLRSPGINWLVISTEAAQLDRRNGASRRTPSSRPPSSPSYPPRSRRVEVHHRHQARARQRPRSSAARRRHVGRCHVPQPAPVLFGRASVADAAQEVLLTNSRMEHQGVTDERHL